MGLEEMRWTVRGMAIATVAILSAPAPVLAGVKEGVDAWQARNYAKAIAEWREPAAKGDPDAQFNLGQAYKLGRGVPADNALAQDYYLKAAQQGHEQAQANLGLILYQNGDRQGALPWLRKAAENGEPRAQYVVGTVLFNGDLLPRDVAHAYGFMLQAAAQGLPQASTSLQQMETELGPEDRQTGLAFAHDLAAKSISADAGDTRRSTAPPRPPRSATTAAAATAPATATTAPKPAATAASGWRVQLGAFSSRTSAETAWKPLSMLDALNGISPIFVAHQALVRLQAGPFASAANARKACQALTAAGRACLPIAP